MSNSEKYFEKCLDADCSFERRLEYCERRIYDSTADGRVIADFIDELIFEDIDLTNELLVHSTSSERSETRRTIALSFIVASTCELDLTELHLYYRSYADQERYGVDIVRKTKSLYGQSDVDDDVSRYRLDFYNDDSGNGVVTENILLASADGSGAFKRRATRTMTEYDYYDLFDRLAQAYDYRCAELADNQRSQ